MAKNVVLAPVATLQNSSIIATINVNDDLIEEAFTDCLSLSGEQPNAMQSNLDMNGNQIINLPAPSTINSPVRLIDVIDSVQGPIGPQGPPGQGAVNINTLSSTPFVIDGVTSNVPMFQSLQPVLQRVGTSMQVPVNLVSNGLGNPTILSINPTIPSGGQLANPCIHYLKPNQAFYFTGGSLSGVTLNTPYYVTAANMTGTQFAFSTINNYNSSIGEGSTVATTGSITGTLSVVFTGQDVNLFIPPGPYFGGNYADSVPNVFPTSNGISRIRYNAYGALFDTKTCFGSQFSTANAKTWAPISIYDYVNTTPNENNVPNLNAVVTLITTANAANYYVGQWISIYGLDLQNPYGHVTSNPANSHYQEYKRIIAINTGTGVLTLDGPLKWIYLSTFPNISGVSSLLVGGGNAQIAPMHPNWDTEVEIWGARWIGQSGETQARRVLFKDCVWQGYGNAPGIIAPSQSQTYVFRNCRFGPGDNSDFMQIDKNMEYLEFDGCTAPNSLTIAFESTAVHECRMKNHQGSTILGTPRQIKVTDSEVNEFLVGQYFGVTDSVDINNSRVTYFDMQQRYDDCANISTANDMTLVPNWSFSNGTFTRNISATNQSMSWQIPGAKVFFTDAGNIFKFGQNMGSPFTILNTYMDGSGNFSFDTTLSAVPTRQTSATVTINIGTGVITGLTLANGTPVVFTTTGALPTGIVPSKAYYVVNTSTNTFQISLTVGGSAITLSGSQSGTHTGFANPLCFRPHPCTRFTSIGNSGCSSLIDQNGSVDEPMFSRVKKAFVGKQNTGSPLSFQIPNSRIWGNLKTLTVNVVKAGTASGTLTISCPGFTQPNLGLSNFSQVIDTTVAGLRSWTGSAAPTGSAGADTIAAYADWVSGPLLFTWSTGVSLTASPIVLFEMTTDQGITRFGNMIGAPGTPSAGFVWQYIDSGINQQFGSTP